MKNYKSRHARKLTFCLIALCALFTPVLLLAEEGMWLLDNLMPLNLPGKGLQIPAEEIWNPENGGLAAAVVSLGGCTASFVSPNGLIVTNHHCAFGAIQRNSSKEKNLLRDGFLAKTLQQELPTFGTNVYILQSSVDVTVRVLRGVSDKLTDQARQEKIEKNINQIVLEAEKEPNISARVASMNSGMWYVLCKSLRIKDVRLVYAPPQSIGKFGGEVDNFEWPRHTGDYSFLRAYVGPDGNPAEPSENNVPYKPKKWLTISTNGYRNGDFTLAMGFPGRTMRYSTSYDINRLVDWYYPARLRTIKGYLQLIDERSCEQLEIAIKLAALKSSWENSLKNNQGEYDGLLRTNLNAEKVAFEKSFMEYLTSNPKLKPAYGEILPTIASLYKTSESYEASRFIINWIRTASSVMRTALSINKWSIEKTKSETERESGFSNSDIADLKDRLKYSYRSFDAELEKRALLLFFSEAHGLPEGQKIKSIESISQGKTGTEQEQADRQFIDNLYEKTRLVSLEQRQHLYDASANQLSALDDAALKFAKQLYQEIEPLDNMEKAFSGAINKLKPKYFEALSKWQGELLYPDANSTKRLTYGNVKDYSPRDAVNYAYYTTTQGVLEKYTGEDPFEAPQALLDLIRGGDYGIYKDAVTDKMHVDFLTTLDSTGGNSGSPVLNAKGELIGLVFDGNYESIVADYKFDLPLTRSICVDIRYVLWLMSNLDKATNLLQEMGL
jgi:hypothetical protein